MQAVPALARRWNRSSGALPDPRCPPLTPRLSLRLQPSLVQPWQPPARRGSSIVSLVYLFLLTAGLSHSPRPVFSGGRGGMRSLQGWVGKFLCPEAAALGRSPGNGCEAAPPRGGRCCCCRHRSCNTNSGRQTTGCCCCSRYPARQGGREEEEGIFRVPSRVLERA